MKWRNSVPAFERDETIDKEPNELTINDLFRMFKRRFPWFLLVVVITIIATLIYAFVSPRVYESSVTIKLSAASTSSISSFLQDLPFGIGGSTGGGSILTEIEMITSKGNIERVIRNIGLLDILIPTERRKPGEPEQALISRAVDSLSEQISVNPVKNTNIVKITAAFPEPELAARIANELAKVYNESLYDINKTQAKEKLRFIEAQLPISKAALDLSIQKVREYKEAKQIFLISEEAKALLEVIADFDKQLNAKKMELQTTQAGIAAIREKLSATNEKLISSETISINPLVSELRSKLTNLNIELASFEKLYPATDPRVLQKKKSIEETQKELSKQVVNIVTSQQKIDNPIYSTLMGELVTKEIDYQLYAATIEAIENGRKEYDQRMKQLPALEQELTEILREESINEQVYVALYKSYIDAQIAEAGIVDQTYIVDAAEPPLYAAKPQKKLIVAIGGVLGVFLGILFVFVLEYLEKRIMDIDELSKMTREAVPIFGFFPKTKAGLLPINPQSPDRALTEAAETAYTRVHLNEHEQVSKVIAITSPERGSGSSTLAYYLAQTIARSRERVLLIDGALRYLNLSKRLGLPHQPTGFSQAISEGFSERIPVVTLQPYLDFLPAGKHDEHPLSLFRGKRFEEWISAMANEYDRILIDTPAMSEDVDASMIIKRTEGVLLVVHLGKTEKRSFEKALRDIAYAQIPLLGLLVNKCQSDNRFFRLKNESRIAKNA